MSPRSIRLGAAGLGAAALGVQLVLLRHFMTVLYGNELVLGICLSAWLVWLAAGSAIGQRAWRRNRPLPGAFAVTLSAALVAALAVYVATRFVRLFFAVPYGEFLTFSEGLLFAFFSLMSPALLFGMSFSLLAALVEQRSLPGEAAAHVYAFEALGSAFAGLGLSVLVLFLSNLTCLLILSLIIFVATFVATRRKFLLAPIIFAGTLLIPPLPHLIENDLLVRYWRLVDKEMRLVDWCSTKFGQACLLDWGGEPVLYLNGAKISALHNPVENQQLAAAILCQHPQPDSVLLIEGNIGGLAPALADLHVQVDALETDGALFEFARSHLDSAATTAWLSESIRLDFADARAALAQSKTRWDIIAVNIGAPGTTFNNRFYTREFFAQIRDRLTADGIFVIANFPAGENFLGPELLALNKILYNTLAAEFARIVVLPGDNALYFAANANDVLTTSFARLNERYAAFAVKQANFVPQMFRYIVQPERVHSFAELLRSSPNQRLNTDNQPVSYLFDFMIWHKIIRGESALLRRLFDGNFAPVIFSALFCLMLLAVIFNLGKSQRAAQNRLRLATGVLGFAAMAFSVILILGFQTIFGYLYVWICIALAVFMGGMGGASRLVNNRLELLKPRLTLVALFFAAILALLLMLPIFALARHIHSTLFFVLMAAFCGALTGAAFPLLCRLYGQHAANPDLGSIYAADVFGGALGALLINSYFIPVGGFFPTILFTALLCLLGLVLVWRT